MTQNHILLLGANGRISKMMIPLFLAKNWSVTALIRDPAQKDGILKLRSDKTPGNLDVLVHSLSDVKTSKDAQGVIDKIKGVNWIVWSAGAGGKEGPNGEEASVMTKAIDQDAAVAFAHAATHNNQIERYLTVSALTSRRNFKNVEWWGAEQQQQYEDSTKGGMAVYTEAKRIADECLTVWGEERQKRDKAFRYVILRPGRLLDDYKKNGHGKIQIGKTRGGEGVQRIDVAASAIELLADGANGWFDLMEAPTVEETVWMALNSKGTSAMEGESIDEMKKTAEDRGRGW